MATKLVKPSPQYEDWMNRKWRPFTAWVYIVICLFDFLVAPLLTFYFFDRNGGSAYTQWQPITLMGSGLFHVAMGAIIGVTAWQRGEEKKSQYRYNRYDYDDNDYGPRERSFDRSDYRDNIAGDTIR